MEDLNKPPVLPQPQKYSPAFKQRVLEATQQTGATLSGVARSYGISVKNLYRWRKADRQATAHPESTGQSSPRHPAAKPRMIPAIRETAPDTSAQATHPEIRIDIRHDKLALQMSWPTSSAHQLGAILRQLLS